MAVHTMTSIVSVVTCSPLSPAEWVKAWKERRRMDKLMTERDEEAIDADLKSMVDAAARAEAKSSKPALSPLHEVRHHMQHFTKRKCTVV